MSKKSANENCCDSPQSCGGFNVEAVISVDDRGQMVLPKDLRARAGIGPGDKLALVSWERDGVVCCMSLIKTDALTEMVKGVLGPMMSEVGAVKPNNFDDELENSNSEPPENSYAERRREWEKSQRD